MIEIIPISCIFLAITFLVIMSIIDLKHFILPDELNLGLAICGILFHVMTSYYYNDILGMGLGALMGGGFLFTIRFFANRYYERDTLGLGDVKLMAAAGIWLGAEGVLQSITLGAAAGLVHGIMYAGFAAYKNKTKFTVSNLIIPAGPGFAVGILITGTFMFQNYVVEVLNDFFA